MKEKLLKVLKKVLIGIASIALVVVGWSLNSAKLLPTGSGGINLATDDCTVSTVANVQVGPGSNTQTILSVNSLRAWARISQVQGNGGFASTTPFLSFDEGAAATVNSGVTLGTSTPSIDFGLATDFPYTGAVTGIMGNGGGTSTVQVVQCLY